MPKHAEATVDRALTLLLFGVSLGEVSKALREEYGTEVSIPTLRTWRDVSHAKRYTELHEKYKDEIEGDAIRRMRERLRLVDQAEMLAVSRVITELENQRLTGKDAAVAALNMSRVKAQNVEKLMQLTGRPTQIIEDRSGAVTDQVLRELMGTGVLKPVSTNGNSHGREEDSAD
jgi:NACalpha-BTF3-like transcription factor